jgi:prepilin-type N-terminal cleavage/methylation domain
MKPQLNYQGGRRGDHRGFTLIELMVVVLIIAILIAIAIPTFLGAKTRAQDKAAQSSLRNAMTNAKVIYNVNDANTYSGASATALGAAEPSLSFVAPGTASSGPKSVSVDQQGSYLVMVVQSSTQSCFAMADWASSGTFFAKVNGTCSATAASTALSATATAPAVPPSTSNSTNTAVNTWVAAW